MNANTESSVVAKTNKQTQQNSFKTSFNVEDWDFKNNQRPEKKMTWNTGNYFDKTQNLCFPGRMLKR